MGGMKVTTRDLLWLTLVVAIFLTWHRSDGRRIAELQGERNQFETWRSEIQTETEKTLARHRIAALNPGAYQDWIKHSDEERRQARQALVKQLGYDENP